MKTEKLLDGLFDRLFAIFSVMYAFRIGVWLGKIAIIYGVLYLIMFSPNVTTKKYKTFSTWERVSYKLFDKTRHQIRKVTSIIIPLKPEYFHNIPSKQAKDLIEPSKALIPLNPDQRAVFAHGYRKHYRVFEALFIKPIFKD